jgi:type II secretory pathway pseudopilin PulG
MVFKNRKKGFSKGFTLIELVLYMGLMSILVGVLGSVFATIVDVQLETEATSSVDQDGRYILSKLLYDVKTATAIGTPGSAGVTSSTLQMTVNSVSYTYSLDSGGNLQVLNNFGTNILNSYDSQISNLSFQRIGNGGSNDTIKTSFTVTSRTQRKSGPESRTFQTTLTRDYRL